MPLVTNQDTTNVESYISEAILVMTLSGAGCIRVVILGRPPPSSSSRGKTTSAILPAGGRKLYPELPTERACSLLFMLVAWWACNSEKVFLQESAHDDMGRVFKSFTSVHVKIIT